jgi:ammonium transporter, Amt family
VNGVIAVILLVPLLICGFAIMNTGLGRARSAAHFMLASLTTFAVAACVYVLWGFTIEGFPGRSAHSFVLANKAWDWVAREPLVLGGLGFDGSPADAAALLQIFTVGLAALIPLAAGADRWRMRATLISTVLLAGWTYPLFAHWVWGGGWLAEIGSNFNLGAGFLDAGGASTIHAVGGLTALAIVWTLGPRLGKYGSGGPPAAIPGHNIVYVLFGCGLMLPGWIALNVAGSLLFAGVGPGLAPLIAVNTVLSAAAGCLAATVTTGLRFTKPDASLCANGWVGGLVASSAVCAFVEPGAAIFTGLIAGILAPLSVEFLEIRLRVDDPGGAISVHGIAGIWGLFAAGVFAHIPSCGDCHPAGQLWAQIIGIATLLGFVLPMSYLLNWILNRFCPHRVDRQGELQGMDLRELGGGAYPEFVVRGDEFSAR